MRLSSITATFPVSGDYPFTDGTTTNSSMNIQSNDNVQGLNFNYNLIANDNISSASLNSLIDGTTPRFESVGLDPADTTTVITMTPVGFNSGHSVFSSTIVGLGKTGSIQKFKITVNFQIIPFFNSVISV